MRNADEVARTIAKSVMDRIESDRGIHLSSIEDEVRKNLLVMLEVPHANAQIAAFPIYLVSGVPVIEHTVELLPGLEAARALDALSVPRNNRMMILPTGEVIGPTED